MPALVGLQSQAHVCQTGPGQTSLVLLTLLLGLFVFATSCMHVCLNDSARQKGSVRVLQTVS